jgi:hypothetical protein
LPRPVNYIAKLRKEVSKTNGRMQEKILLLEGIKKYADGEIKLMDLSMLLQRYNKTCIDEPVVAIAADDDLKEWLDD